MSKPADKDEGAKEQKVRRDTIRRLLLSGGKLTKIDFYWLLKKIQGDAIGKGSLVYELDVLSFYATGNFDRHLAICKRKHKVS